MWAASSYLLLELKKLDDGVLCMSSASPTSYQTGGLFPHVNTVMFSLSSSLFLLAAGCFGHIINTSAIN